MNGMYRMGYEDAKNFKDRAYECGPVGIVGIATYDYNQGYAAANRDRVWTNGNRPPMNFNG